MRRRRDFEVVRERENTEHTHEHVEHVGEFQTEPLFTHDYTTSKGCHEHTRQLNDIMSTHQRAAVYTVTYYEQMAQKRMHTRA